MVLQFFSFQSFGFSFNGETLRFNINYMRLIEDKAIDKNEQEGRIYVANPM